MSIKGSSRRGEKEFLVVNNYAAGTADAEADRVVMATVARHHTNAEPTTHKAT